MPCILGVLFIFAIYLGWKECEGGKVLKREYETLCFFAFPLVLRWIVQLS